MDSAGRCGSRHHRCIGSASMNINVDIVLRAGDAMSCDLETARLKVRKGQAGSR